MSTCIQVTRIQVTVFFPLRQARKFKFPCGVCSAPVKSNLRGVQCECCYYWLHAWCIGMDGEEYTHLQNSTDPWCCKKYLDEALPFFSVSNSDSIFDCSSSSSSSSPSTPSVCNTTQPQLPTPPHLTFLNLNCRSLLPKLDDLRVFAEAQSPDVITLCETWLDDSIKNDEVAIEGYVLVRRDRNRHGGGIGVYIRESLSFSQTLIHASVEFLLISLNLKSWNLLCGLFYRPPSSPHAVATLESALESLPPAKLKSLILLGDFNIKLECINVEKSSHTKEHFWVVHITCSPSFSKFIHKRVPKFSIKAFMQGGVGL